MPRLQVLNGKRQGATFDVGRGGVVVGHRNTAPVSIDDPWVSWDHARLFLQNDAFWIEDLGSTNGTFVNCVRVKRERLNHEDIIFFGKTHVIFLVPDLQSVSGDGDSSPSEEKKRSNFEVNVEAIAAAAQGRPTGVPFTPSFKNGGANGRTSGVSQATTVAPNRDDLRALPTNPMNPGTGRFEPGEDSSRSQRDPFRPGADPWEKKAPLGNPLNNKGSSALANLDPDADPFSSARAENTKNDPFSVGQDPFDAPRQRSVADTQHDLDEERPTLARSTSVPTTEDRFSQRAGPGFENFDIDENEPDPLQVAPVSAAEVSSLLEANKKSSDGEEQPSLDDLDALLGDNAARTPDPGLYRASDVGPAPRPKKKPSEALTRPFDTVAANEALVEPPRRSSPSRTALDMGGPPISAPPIGSSRFTGPPVPANAAPATRSGTGRIAPLPPDMASNARTQPLTAQNPPPPPPPPPPPAKTDEGRPTASADLAFEVAKLQDEVRRLRMALDAARQADPEKVRVAVEGLRAEELGRQAREIADLRRDLAALDESHKKTQAELDDVTTDMINKEDTIDALEKKVARLGGGAQRAPAAGQSADELRALEF